MYKNDKLWKGGSPDERIAEQELKQPVVQQDQQQQEPGWNASQWRLERGDGGYWKIWTVFWGRWMERYAGRFRIGGPSLPGSVLTLNTSFGSIFSYSVNVKHHLSKVLKSQMLWINQNINVSLSQYNPVNWWIPSMTFKDWGLVLVILCLSWCDQFMIYDM